MARKVSIPKNWDVPATFHRQVSEIAGSQRTLADSGHILVILHELPTTSSAERSIRMFWRSPDGTWKSDSLGQGIESLRTHITEYAKRVHHCERQLALAKTADDYFTLRRQTSPVRRAAHNMHATLQRSCEACPEDHQLLSCRNWAGTIERALELVYEESQHGLDYAMASNTELQTRASYRLNLLAAIFLPIATAASVFGMNLHSGLEERFDPWLFWGVLVIGVAVGIMVQANVARNPTRQRSHGPKHESTEFDPGKYA